jgi:hypothetical protein
MGEIETRATRRYAAARRRLRPQIISALDQTAEPERTADTILDTIVATEYLQLARAEATAELALANLRANLSQMLGAVVHEPDPASSLLMVAPASDEELLARIAELLARG